MKFEQNSLLEVVQEKLVSNPLVGKIQRILNRVADFKERARSFYFEVILSIYNCPKCAGRLQMIGQSQCECSCGNTFDPTLFFQKSTCCSTKLVRKTFHYACSRCNKIILSRFLFDEKVFDKTYFREMMQESRKKKKQKREEIRRLLAESKSGILPFMEEPDLDSVPDLIHDLDNFIHKSDEMYHMPFYTESSFNIDDYRDHILSILTWNSMHFSDIIPMIDDLRQDRVWRFITLVYMQNDHEVDLAQHGSNILIQKVYNETHDKG